MTTFDSALSRSRRLARLSAAVAAIVAFPVAASAAGADSAELVPGAVFPAVSSQSPSGVAVTLPPAGGGPFVVVYANTKKGGDSVVAWSHALYKRLPSRIAVYAVADLSSVPGLFRGFAVADVRKSANPSQPQHRDHILVLTAKNALSSVMPPGSGDDAAIVAVDGSGKVARAQRETYTDAAAASEATRIETSLPAAKP